MEGYQELADAIGVGSGLLAATIMFGRAFWLGIHEARTIPKPEVIKSKSAANSAPGGAIIAADEALAFSLVSSYKQEQSIWFFLRLGTGVAIAELTAAGILASRHEIKEAQTIGGLITVFGTFLAATTMVGLARLKAERGYLLGLREMESMFERKVALLALLGDAVRDQGICQLLQMPAAQLTIEEPLAPPQVK